MPKTLPISSEEIARRKTLREEENALARDKAAVIFMCNWMKRRGVTKDDLLGLGVWSDAEVTEITKIYRYAY